MPPRTQPVESQRSSRQEYLFKKPDDIRQRIKVQNEESLIETLTALRNQITIHANDGPVQATDERLLLVKAWMDAAPGAQDIFDIWDQANTRQLPLLSLVISVLSAILALLSVHYTYHSDAAAIVKNLLLPKWSSKLNTYLSTSHNELILVTLKLYNTLTAFAGGRERRALLDIFPWDAKPLPKLLHMRRRRKANEVVDILARPDIRTLYVQFLLSFVDSSTQTQVKAMFLEQRRDLFTPLFRGLDQDSYPVVRQILEICWIGIWNDSRLKRTLKIGLFNESVVSQILKLYERSSPEGNEPDSIPADVAHHFLLAICTHPGVGICFKDQGWYPREDREDDTRQDNMRAGPSSSTSRIHNRILANIVKTLKVNEDSRQQELALRILSACPELVAGYWSGAALTLEPRLSSRWIANIAFFGTVVSLPVPQANFLLPNSSLYRPSPPQLVSLVENILPSSAIHHHLSRGLQSSSSLVQHCAAIALTKALVKYGAVLKAMRTAESALEEDEDGQWWKRREELEHEVARRVPEFQVVLAYVQQKTSETRPSSAFVSSVKTALLAESAQRLLWLYHEYLPEIVAEARFDAGKLLVGIQQNELGDDASVQGLVRLRQLHVLRLLSQSDQFSLQGKAGSSKGAFSVLLKLYVSSAIPAAKRAVSSLLKQTLSATLIFQHDPDEVDIWLSALPGARYDPSTASDGLFVNEVDFVLTFVDDCFQRCIKTPYRYLDELQTLLSGYSEDNTSPGQQSVSTPSPLLATVLEQYKVKVANNLLHSSELLSVVCFIRKLLWALVQKIDNIASLQGIASQVISSSVRLVGIADSPTQHGLNHELGLLEDGLSWLIQSDSSAPSSASPTEHLLGEEFAELQLPADDTYLSGERSPTFAGRHAREARAEQLLDWLRVQSQPLTIEQSSRLITAIYHLSPAVYVHTLYHLSPRVGSLWEIEEDSVRMKSVGFPLLFMHSHDVVLASEQNRELLVGSLYVGGTSGITGVKGALRMIDHRLAAASIDSGRCDDLVLLIHSVVIATPFSMSERTELVLYVLQLDGFRMHLQKPLSSTGRAALGTLLKDLCACASPEGKAIISTTANMWIAPLQEMSAMSDGQLATAIMWMQFADQASLGALLDSCDPAQQTSERSAHVLKTLLSALGNSVDNLTANFLSDRLPLLLALRTGLPEVSILDRLIDNALTGLLPLFFDAHLPKSPVDALEMLKSSRMPSPVQVDEGETWVRRYLSQSTWTSVTASIVAKLVYLDGNARIAVRAWLGDGVRTRHALHIAPVLQALLDCHPSSPWSNDGDLLGRAFALLVRNMTSVSPDADVASRCVSCLGALPRLPQVSCEQLLSAMEKECRAPEALGTPHLLECAQWVAQHTTFNNSVFVQRALELGLQWSSSNLADSEDILQMLDRLTALVHIVPFDIKPHVAEALLNVVLHDHLESVCAVRLAAEVVAKTKLKPASANRLLQNIVQHPKFSLICAVASPTRSATVSLLTGLFRMHPANSCQPSHVEPLVAFYGGTLSKPDQQLKSIFKLFEVTRKASVSSLLSHWSPLGGETSENSLQALLTLDPTTTWRTCLHYPQWTPTDSASGHEDQLYDPEHLLFVFSQMQHESHELSTTVWVQLFRTNIVGVFIRALSSHVEPTRAMSLSQLACLYQRLQDADVHEKPHVLYILDLLRDVYVENTGELVPARLPAFVTLNLAHALHGVFYSSHFTYPLTARFLLQRPELDSVDVPLLYTMLYSTSDQWRRERVWIMRFLADGMVGRTEWRVLQRRHTWDLVASLFNDEKDIALRRCILELLANISCNKHAATSLLLGSALVCWIEVQLRSLRPLEALAWVKILENIVTVVDFSRVEKATDGDWRTMITRCLVHIVSHPSCTHVVLLQAVRLAARMVRVAVRPSENTAQLVKIGTRRMHQLEGILADDATFARRAAFGDVVTPPSPPYQARQLWESPELSMWSTWGQIVNALWTIAMGFDACCPEWQAITSRMLLWRAISGEDQTPAEWVRNQAVHTLTN